MHACGSGSGPRMGIWPDSVPGAPRGPATASRWPGCAPWPSGAAPRCCYCAGPPRPAGTCPRSRARTGRQEAAAAARGAAGRGRGAGSSGREVAAVVCSWLAGSAPAARSPAGSAAQWRPRRATAAQATIRAAGRPPPAPRFLPGWPPGAPGLRLAGSG